MRKIFLFAPAVLALLLMSPSHAQTITSSVVRWGLDPVVVSGCPAGSGIPNSISGVTIYDENNSPNGGPYSCNNGLSSVRVSYRLLLPGTHALSAQFCTSSPIGPFVTTSCSSRSTPTPVSVVLAGTPIAELGTRVTVVGVYANATTNCQGSAGYVPPTATSFPPPPGMTSPQYIEVTSTCAGTVGLELPFAPNNGDIQVYYPGSGWHSITTADPEVGFYGSFAIVPVGSHGWIAFSHVVPTTTPGIAPKTGLWWGGADQSGWGLHIASHASTAGDRLFLAGYVYDANGNPTWVVMPSGAWDTNHTTWTGDLFTPHGSPFSSYDATHYVPGAALGQGALKFSSDGSAQFTFVAGAARDVQFFEFAADPSPGSYQGLWWGGPAQNGWGLSIAQQGEQLFATWFTYDASGNAAWYYMPGATKLADGHYSGALYRTSGGPWPTQVPYVGSATKVFAAGTLDLQFTNGEAGTMKATVDGKSVTVPISRFDF